MDIRRILVNNNKFEYYINGNKITDENIFNRIKKNCIPPSWNNVKISNSNTDYLQVTGYDSKNRKQYIYHPMWKEMSKEEKYKRLEHFVNNLPILIRHMNKKLRDIDISKKEHIILLIIKILTKTYSRIGNDIYTKENNTYGLTTLQKKHVSINSDVITIKYIGKKNIEQEFSFTDEVCKNTIKKLLMIPGNRLFKTSDQQLIRSSDVNNYIKEVMGGDYTSKDFRTYASNVMLLKLLYKRTEMFSSDREARNYLNECCDKVASIIGHTAKISKKNYIYPIIFEYYTKDYNLFIKKRLSISDLLHGYI